MKPIRLEKLLNFCQTNLLRLTNIIAYKQNMKQRLIGLKPFSREKWHDLHQFLIITFKYAIEA